MPLRVPHTRALASSAPRGDSARTRSPSPDRCTVRSAQVNVPVFSPQVAAGSTTSASIAVSVMKMSWTTTNRFSWARMRRMRARSGRETAGFVAEIHSSLIEPCSA